MSGLQKTRIQVAEEIVSLFEENGGFKLEGINAINKADNLVEAYKKELTHNKKRIALLDAYIEAVRFEKEVIEPALPKIQEETDAYILHLEKDILRTLRNDSALIDKLYPYDADLKARQMPASAEDFVFHVSLTRAHEEALNMNKSLSEAVEKFKVVKEIKEKLDNKTTSASDKVQACLHVVKNNVATLEKCRADSLGEKFFKAIGQFFGLFTVKGKEYISSISKTVGTFFVSPAQPAKKTAQPVVTMKQK